MWTPPKKKNKKKTKKKKTKQKKNKQKINKKEMQTSRHFLYFRRFLSFPLSSQNTV